MDNFIQELEDDLRRDRHLALWQKYGRYAVTLALVLIIGAAVAVAWRHYRAGERMKDSATYSAAVTLAGQGTDASREAALKSLRGIVQSGSDSYAALARLKEAALLAESGKPEEAVAIYDATAGNSDVAPMFRDLAVLLHALVMLDKEDPAALTGRLAPLTTGSSAWRHSALELTALLAQRNGDDAKAREIYTALADDPTTPQQLRGRAAEMLAVLGAANG
jgi:hypothetical protein